MRFPYIEFRGRFAPMVPIRFKLKDKEEWVKFHAYVDSGAGYSIFHSDVTEILGLRLEDGRVDYVTVGDGSQIKVYLHQIKIQMATEEFEATIGFSRNLGIGFNVIGRLDLFSKFKLCFDEEEKIIEFHPKTIES
ncbi:MAG: hypothetical protein AB1797_11775 [bacterium]